MQVGGVAASFLVVFALYGTNGDSNITILHFPINLTSWRTSLHEAFNFNKTLSARLSSALNSTFDFLKNGSISCTPQGEECIPEVPSCCPSMTSGHVGSYEDEDLHCLPQGDVHRCSLIKESTEDIAELRLNALEYGDSAGVLESHPWVNSWEFQSRSEAEREELQALQEADWKKQWKPSSQENFWLKTYKKVKNEAMDVWKDLRKMKKLKEVKDNLIEKKNKRLEPTISPMKEETPATQKMNKVMYPDELSEEPGEDQTKSGSEESIIKFSDELPKQKKIDFRLDDIIKNAFDLASQKIKKKTKQGSEPTDKVNPVIPSLASEEELLRLEQIQGTVDKLMSEINELKKVKQQREELEELGEGLNNENEVAGPSIDELIKKHVHNILQEERRLHELRKVEEAKRLKLEGTLNT